MNLDSIHIATASDEMLEIAQRAVDEIHPKGAKLSEYENRYIIDGVIIRKPNGKGGGDEFYKYIIQYLRKSKWAYIFETLRCSMMATARYKIPAGKRLILPVGWHVDTRGGKMIDNPEFEISENVLTVIIYCEDTTDATLQISKMKYVDGMLSGDVSCNKKIHTNAGTMIVMPEPFLHRVPVMSTGTRAMISCQVYY